MPAVVDKDKCNACCDKDRMECVFNCPYDAFSLVNGKSQVDPDLCDDCKLCIDVCPQHAISHK
jgi:uncharacterized protein